MFYAILQSTDKQFNIKNLFFKSIFSFFIASVFSYFISINLWPQDTTILHTGFEAACVFIAISSFFIMWNTFEICDFSNYVIGFGFLVVSLFDILHIYYWPKLDLNPQHYFDLSTYYWILGRLTESILLLISTLGITKIKTNKWLGLAISILFSLSTALIIFIYRPYFPQLLTSNGVTPLKRYLEYFIMLLFVLTLLRLRKNINRNSIINYNYIFIAALLAIPAELSLTLYKSVSSFANVFGHTLKVVYYYYLFKGIFVNTVTFPIRNLEKTNKYFESLLNELPIGIITYNANKIISFINQRGANLLGINPESIYGLSASQMAKKFYRHDINKVPMLNYVSDENKAVKNRIRTITKEDGEDLKVVGDVLKLDNGNYLYLFDDAKKEQELENLQIQTQTILNSINNLVLITNSSDEIIMCNNACEQILEISKDELLNSKLKYIYKQLKAKMTSAYSDESNSSTKMYEAKILTANKSVKELMLNSSEIDNIDGEKMGRIIIASDITSFKEHQKELQHKESLAFLGQTSAAIVHEIKNMIASVKGLCQLIILKTTDDNILNYTYKIQDITSSVNVIMTDFLKFSKPRTPMLSKVLIGEILSSMKYILDNETATKGVNLEITINPEEKFIMADENQIKQVILNLVKNASEAVCEVTNPKVQIIVQNDDFSNEMIISITDNGIGIPKEALSKLGKPFYTTKALGTGLGLSTSYQIVSQHSGRIEISSELGKGSTFTLHFPYAAKMIQNRSDKIEKDIS